MHPCTRPSIKTANHDYPKTIHVSSIFLSSLLFTKAAAVEASRAQAAIVHPRTQILVAGLQATHFVYFRDLDVTGAKGGVNAVFVVFSISVLLHAVTGNPL